MGNTYLRNGRYPRKFRLAFVGSLIFVTSAFIGIGHTAVQDLTNNPYAGNALYHSHCLRCHGALGDGKGPDVASLIVPPRDFHTPESISKSDYELRSIIIWGLVFSDMHSWGFRLTPQEIRDLISYIRELAPYQPRI